MTAPDAAAVPDRSPSGLRARLVRWPGGGDSVWRRVSPTLWRCECCGQAARFDELDVYAVEAGGVWRIATRDVLAEAGLDDDEVSPRVVEWATSEPPAGWDAPEPDEAAEPVEPTGELADFGVDGHRHDCSATRAPSVMAIKCDCAARLFAIAQDTERQLALLTEPAPERVHFAHPDEHLPACIVAGTCKPRDVDCVATRIAGDVTCEECRVELDRLLQVADTPTQPTQPADGGPLTPAGVFAAVRKIGERVQQPRLAQPGPHLHRLIDGPHGTASACCDPTAGITDPEPVIPRSCLRCGGPLGDAMDSADHACPNRPDQDAARGEWLALAGAWYDHETADAWDRGEVLPWLRRIIALADGQPGPAIECEAFVPALMPGGMTSRCRKPLGHGITAPGNRRHQVDPDGDPATTFSWESRPWVRDGLVVRTADTTHTGEVVAMMSSEGMAQAVVDLWNRWA